MFNFGKTITLTAALGMGTAAAANGTFGFQTTVEDDSSVTIDLVRTETAGVLAIYDYSTGEFGELLGTADLSMGANDDVIVPLNPNGANQLAAVIYEGELGEPTMASGWIELDVSDAS